MSINSEIQRIKNNIRDAFIAVDGKGGTVPASRVSANLATAISTIPTGGGGRFIAISDSEHIKNDDHRQDCAGVFITTSMSRTSIVKNCTTITNQLNLSVTSMQRTEVEVS